MHAQYPKNVEPFELHSAAVDFATLLQIRHSLSTPDSRS